MSAWDICEEFRGYARALADAGLEPRRVRPFLLTKAEADELRGYLRGFEPAPTVGEDVEVAGVRCRIVKS